MHKSKTALTVVAALAALTCLATASARAQVVYDNGSFIGATNARNISFFAIADDFAVAGSLTFDAIRFYALDTAPGLLPNFSGSLSWFIYDSSIGTTPSAIPGASILASGTVSGSAITVADTGATVADFGVAQLDFSIPTQTLGSGMYWLRLKEGTLASTEDATPILWVHKNGAITGNGFRADTNEVAPPTWANDGTNTTDDLSYQLLNNVPVIVPESGTVALLLPTLGVIGGAFVAQRRTA